MSTTTKSPISEAVRGRCAEYAIAIFKASNDALNGGLTITYGEVAEASGISHPIPWISTDFNVALDMVLDMDYNVAANIVEKHTGKPSPMFYAWCDQRGIAYPTREYPAAKKAKPATVTVAMKVCSNCWMVAPCDCDAN